MIHIRVLEEPGNEANKQLGYHTIFPVSEKVVWARDY